MNRLTMQEIQFLAEQVEASMLFNGGQKLPAAQAFIKIMIGQELGLEPTVALRGIFFSRGKPVFEVAIIGILLHNNGYVVVPVEHNQHVCRLNLTREGQVVGQSSFAMEEAKQAGLLREGESNWKKYPEDMLWARAISRLARRYAPHIFGGAVYGPEEIPTDDNPAEQPAPAPQLREPAPTDRRKIATPDPARESIPEATQDILGRLREMAITQLGRDRKAVWADLCAFAGTENAAEMSAETIERHMLERYTGQLDAVEFILGNAPAPESETRQALNVLTVKHGCLADIPFTALSMLIDSLMPVDGEPRQDARERGDDAANALFGTDDGIRQTEPVAL